MISKEEVEKSMVPWKPELCNIHIGSIKESYVDEIEIATFYSKKAYPITIEAIRKMIRTVKGEG